MHIRVNDLVEVMVGDDRGTRAKVIRIEKDRRRLVVEGVNKVYKHVKRSQKNPQGGRLSKEMPVSVSNIAIVCDACKTASRTGVEYDSEGAKFRVCKKCKARTGQLAPARKSRTV